MVKKIIVKAPLGDGVGIGDTFTLTPNGRYYVADKDASKLLSKEIVGFLDLSGAVAYQEAMFTEGDMVSFAKFTKEHSLMLLKGMCTFNELLREFIRRSE